MTTITIPDGKSTKKEIIKFILSDPNREMIMWDKGMNKTKLLDVVNQLVNFNSEVVQDITDVLPEVVELPKTPIGNGIVHIPVEEKEKTRKEQIEELFNEFGKEHGFTVKKEKKHNGYIEFNRTRLVEHITWWYLVRKNGISQRNLMKVWNTPQRQTEVSKLMRDPLLRKHLRVLFPNGDK